MFIPSFWNKKPTITLEKNQLENLLFLQRKIETQPTYFV